MSNPTEFGTNNLPDLHACPFCGNSDIEIHPNDLASCGRQMSNPHTDANYAHCDGCGMDGPVGMTDAEARELWNRRAQPEGEAPQAVPVTLSEGKINGQLAMLISLVKQEAISDERAESEFKAWAQRVYRPAAQHADSGARMITVPASLPEWAQQNIDCDEDAEEKKAVSDALGASLAAQSQGAQAPVPREFGTAIEDLHTVVNVIAERLDGDGRTAMARRLQNAAVDVDLTARAAISAKAETPTCGSSHQPPGAAPARPNLHGVGDAIVHAAQQAAAPGAQPMTYDEFFAEARRLGCKLSADVCAELAAAPDYSAPGTPEAPALAPGHREDWYLMANARAMLAQRYSRQPNWVVAKELFATGSTSAHRICRDAGIDPDSFRVQRAAQLDGGAA